MSHSYRKDCRIKDHNKGQKRLANKKVSKNKNILPHYIGKLIILHIQQVKD